MHGTYALESWLASREGARVYGLLWTYMSLSASQTHAWSQTSDYISVGVLGGLERRYLPLSMGISLGLDSTLVSVDGRHDILVGWLVGSGNPSVHARGSAGPLRRLRI